MQLSLFMDLIADAADVEDADLGKVLGYLQSSCLWVMYAVGNGGAGLGDKLYISS